MKAYPFETDKSGEDIEEKEYYSNHGEEIAGDSCWGFYGLDYMRKEVESVAQSIIDRLPAEPEPVAAYPLFGTRSSKFYPQYIWCPERLFLRV